MNYRILNALLMSTLFLSVLSGCVAVYTKLASWFIIGLLFAGCTIVLYITKVWFVPGNLEEVEIITVGDHVYLEDIEKVVYIRDYSDLEAMNAYDHRLATKEEIELFIRNNN